MKKFERLCSLQEVNQFIKENSLAFLYISREDCSVCHSLLPQIRNLLADYPKIKLALIQADEIEAVAGAFLVFTVPAMLLFWEGKEVVREARFVHLDALKSKLQKVYQP